jgi:hypothetical protein
MAKATTTAAPAATAPNTNPTTAVNAGPQYRPLPGVIGLTPAAAKATFRGARGAWFAVLQAHNGQPANNYLAACVAKPPSLPASGRAEAPTGWLSWFVRNGYATVTMPSGTQLIPPKG